MWNQIRVFKGCGNRKLNNVTVHIKVFLCKLAEKNPTYSVFFFTCSHCPLVKSLSFHKVRSWVWEQVKMTGWVLAVGHRVSLQWQSSLYICLLSRGISSWPKLNGCPNARHLQYYKMVEKIWGEEKKNTISLHEQQINNTLCQTVI